MKNFFIVFFASGLFPAIITTTLAQTGVNPVAVPGHSTSPKFIEGIEIKPVLLQSSVPVMAEPIKELTILTNESVAPATSKPLIETTSGLQFKYAQLMNTEVESVTNISLFQCIEEWWGTRYRYGGTTKSGIDCSAFVGLLYQTVYKQQMPRTARAQFHVTAPVNRNEMKEGDLLFFNTRGGVSHVGLYVGNGCFVHSSTSSGVTISKLQDDYYSNRFIRAGRFSEEATIPEEDETACID